MNITIVSPMPCFLKYLTLLLAYWPSYGPHHGQIVCSIVYSLQGKYTPNLKSAYVFYFMWQTHIVVEPGTDRVETATARLRASSRLAIVHRRLTIIVQDLASPIF